MFLKSLIMWVRLSRNFLKTKHFVQKPGYVIAGLAEHRGYYVTAGLAEHMGIVGNFVPTYIWLNH